MEPRLGRGGLMLAVEPKGLKLGSTMTGEGTKQGCFHTGFWWLESHDALLCWISLSVLFPLLSAGWRAMILSFLHSLSAGWRAMILCFLHSLSAGWRAMSANIYIYIYIFFYMKRTQLLDWILDWIPDWFLDWFFKPLIQTQNLKNRLIFRLISTKFTFSI